MPAEGFSIGKGFVEVEAYVDESQIDKSMDTAGRRAGTKLNMTASDTIKRGSHITDALGEQGGRGAEGFTRTFGSRLKSILPKAFGKDVLSKIGDGGSTAGSAFSSFFKDGISKSLLSFGSEFSAMLLPAAIAAGPIIGATLGAGIIGALGLGTIAAGIFFAAKDSKVKAAGKQLRNTVFGMSKEDTDKIATDLQAAQKKLASMQKKGPDALRAAQDRLKKAQVLGKPEGIASAQYDIDKIKRDQRNGTGADAGDIAAQQKIVADLQKKQDSAGTSMFQRATAAFIPVTTKALQIFSDMFVKLEPTITTIFNALAPGVLSLANGLSAAITAFMPGFSAIMQQAQPFISIISTGFTRVGKALGDMLNKWASDPMALEGMKKALGDIFGLIVTLINWFRDFVISASETYLRFRNAWGAIANWFTGTIVPSFMGAINNIKGAFWAVVNWFTGPFKNFFVSIWSSITGWFGGVVASFKHSVDNIKNAFQAVIGWFTGPFKSFFVGVWNSITSTVGTKVNQMKNFFTNLRDGVHSIFTSIGNKITDFKNGAVRAFQLARDGIGKAWDGIKDKAKAPVNFVIDPVYKNIRNLWNGVANKVGLGKLALPEIKKFATGGTVPGMGMGDTVPAMLTPGEGILTRDEMKRIGGPDGFAELRNNIQHFSIGGIVGGIKDWAGGKLKQAGHAIGGLVRGALYPGAKALADKYVYPLINQMGFDGFSGLMRGGSFKLMNNALAWLKGDDKKNSGGAMGNGTVMGWQKMLAAINGAGFNFHPSVGQTYGGTHAPGSYHYQGRAIDLSPPSMKVFDWIRSTYGHNIKELIYGPAGGRNIKNGQPHNYSPALLAQHYNHVHFAMKNGGVINEPVMGVGMHSGKSYAFGENGPETVTPGVGGNGSTFYIENITVQADQLSDMQQAIETLEGLGMAVMAGAH